LGQAACHKQVRSVVLLRKTHQARESSTAMTDDTFETHRPRLLGIAYRLLGSFSEAEDAVQDVFLRWLQNNSGRRIENPSGWLTKVCTNRCLDILKSAHNKRMSYVGPWLPEPLQTDIVGSSEDALALSSALSTAFLVLLERLTPKERAAYLLREVFDYDYGDAAEILEMDPANCRKLVSRARKHLGKEVRRTITASNFQETLLKEFQRAIETGDTDDFAKLLSKSAQLHADGGGKAIAAEHVLAGSVKIQSFVQDVLHVAWRGMEFQLSIINGDPGLVLLREGEVFGCVTCATKDNIQVASIFIVRNPEKLTRLGRQIKVGPGIGSLTTEEKSVQ